MARARRAAPHASCTCVRPASDIDHVRVMLLGNVNTAVARSVSQVRTAVTSAVTV